MYTYILGLYTAAKFLKLTYKCNRYLNPDLEQNEIEHTIRDGKIPEVSVTGILINRSFPSLIPLNQTLPPPLCG